MLKKTALACLLVAPSLASAQGIYFLAGVGTGSVDLGDIEATYGPGYTSDDELQRAVIGVGAEVNPFLAFEGSYLSEVENSVTNPAFSDTLEHSGLQLAVLGKAPVTAQFSVFGKLSANYMATTYHFQDTALTQVYDEDKAGAYLGFGGGLSFQANDQVGLRLQAERIFLKDITIVGNSGLQSADFAVDQATLALTFSF